MGSKNPGTGIREYDAGRIAVMFVIQRILKPKEIDLIRSKRSYKAASSFRLFSPPILSVSEILRLFYPTDKSGTNG